MNKNVTRGLFFALCVGGLTLGGAVAANAATTTGADGIASGTQIAPNVDAPVFVTRNAFGIVGDAVSTATSPATAPVPAAPVPAPAPAAPVPAPAPAGPTTSGKPLKNEEINKNKQDRKSVV